MSRIGKKLIEIPEGVNVKIDGRRIVVSGKGGELTYTHEKEVKIVSDGKKLEISVVREVKGSRAKWGLTRSLVNNMVKGVSEGFKQTLQVKGVGYRASVKGSILSLYLGFSHEIKFAIPSDIEIRCPKQDLIEISATSNERLGSVTSLIRQLRMPEPYKGKGVRFLGEVVFLKEGKKK
jgi:large subunit ribosomal protein L6